MRRLAAGVNTMASQVRPTASSSVKAPIGTSSRVSPMPHADSAAISPSRLSRASASVTPRNSVIGISNVK